jgi:hypothetical protein
MLALASIETKKGETRGARSQSGFFEHEDEGAKVG